MTTYLVKLTYDEELITNCLFPTYEKAAKFIPIMRDTLFKSLLHDNDDGTNEAKRVCRDVADAMVSGVMTY